MTALLIDALMQIIVLILLVVSNVTALLDILVCFVIWILMNVLLIHVRMEPLVVIWLMVSSVTVL